MGIALVLVFLFTAPLIFFLQDRIYLTQYLFFIRFSLLWGAIIFLLPWVGPEIARDSLSNVFVLEGWISTALVVFLAYLTAWAALYTGRLTWVSVPARNNLFLSRKRHAEWRAGSKKEQREILEELHPKAWAWHIWAAAGSLLLVPLLVRLFESSPHRSRTLIGIGVGLAAALSLRAASSYRQFKPNRGRAKVRLLERHLEHLRGQTLRYHTLRFVSQIPRSLWELPWGIQRLHWTALGLSAATGIIYALLFALTNPAGKTWALENTPALAFVYLLLLLIVWITTSLSYHFDRSRVPAVGLLILIILGWQVIFEGTHYYQVIPPQNVAQDSIEPKTQLDLGAALGQRIASAGERPLVLVGASGGGITASLWTAQVLAGLEQELGGASHSFHEQIALISSVSGGGVGSMYYIDACSPNGIDPQHLQDVVTNSGGSSLAASVWGMVYPDLWRLALAPVLGIYDRGWAQEKLWDGRLREPSATLFGWRKGIAAGWRPIPIFNATLEETGERYLMSPLSIERSPELARRSLSELYPGHDMPVTTAARLSATFPFISPQSKALVGEELQDSAYHASDGGFFDNSGIFTLLECLHEYVQMDNGPRPQRVAVIEIRAAPRRTPDISGSEEEVISSLSQQDAPAPRSVKPAVGGLLNSSVGPLRTLAAVRGTSQLARNEIEAALSSAAWAQQEIELQTFTFQLSDGLPLSWHLTEEEKRHITSHWPLPAQDDTELSANLGPDWQEQLLWIRKRNLESLQRLKQFVQ